MDYVGPSRTLFQSSGDLVTIQTWEGEQATLPLSDLVAYLHFLKLDDRLLLDPDSFAHADTEGLLHEFLADRTGPVCRTAEGEDDLSHLRSELVSL